MREKQKCPRRGDPNRPATAAVLYAAKSTKDPRGSIPTQLDDAREMAEREGFEVVAEFSDEAASAWSGDRGPGLAGAMERAEREAPSVLVVQHSDRLARGDARKARHLVEVVTWAVKAGVTIRSVEDDLFADERVSVLMGALMGMRNTEDSERKSEAVKAGKRRAFERGGWGGGPTPDGFELVKDGEERVLRLDPDRIEVVRLIGSLADEGWGDRSIARELNRRDLRTKGDGAWTRSRIQDLLTNPVYCGGLAWRRNTPDEEVNWDARHPAPWTREDFERRLRARGSRDSAPDRHEGGHPHTNHALAGLAFCGECMERMRPETSSYRRKDGSRQRTYVCRNVELKTGACGAPAVDAELVDAHVVNGLGAYLGDFEAWRDRLTTGYASERIRLEREVAKAEEYLAEGERIAAKRDRLPDLAEDEGEMREALRLVREGKEERDRRAARLEAARRALDEVPTEAPADAMLDFYNELGEAVRGRLDGANTLSRVNDALRDLFFGFVLEAPGTHPDGDGIRVTPVLAADRAVPDAWWDRVVEHADDHPTTPPLRRIEVPSSLPADAS